MVGTHVSLFGWSLNLFVYYRLVQLRPERSSADFRGTTMYASAQAHHHKDLSKRFVAPVMVTMQRLPIFLKRVHCKGLRPLSRPYARTSDRA